MAAIEQLSPQACPPSNDEPYIEPVSDNFPIEYGHVEYSVYLSDKADPTNTKLVVPGYLGVMPTYECLGRALAESGQNAIVYRPHRRQKLDRALHPEHLFKPLKLSGQVTRSTMVDTHNKYGFDNFDLLAHSMGGPSSMQLVDNRPDNIRSVLLIGSAGLDRHNPVSLSLRLPKALTEIIPALPNLTLDRQRAVKHVLHYTFDNPIRTITEGLAVSRSDIRESVQRARSIGIFIGRLQFKADPFFPIDRITDLDKAAVDLYREFPDPNAGHLALLLQAKEVAKSASEMIDTMTANK